MQSSPIGIALLDHELRYLHVSRSLALLNGAPQEQHLGHTLEEMLPLSENTDTLLRGAHKVLTTKVPVLGLELELREPWPTAGPRLVRISMLPLRQGEQEPPGLCIYVEDLTDYRKAEAQRDEVLARERTSRELAESTTAALAESEGRYRAILTALAEGIVLQDAEGFIVSHNASAERILGLTRDEMTGRTSMDPRWQAIHEDGSPFPGQDHPSMVSLRTGEPQRNIPMGIQKPGGQRVWLSINSQPLWNPGASRPYAVVTSFFEVTEHKRLLQEAQEAVRTRDEFLSVAAHELRTPLTSLRLQLHLVLRGQAENFPEQARRVQVIERQLNRLSSLVNALLDVSRLTSGSLSMEPKELDLAELVREHTEAFAEEFSRAHCPLRLHAPASVPGRWDPLRLEQVLLNLLSNAVKYGAGKPVSVSVRQEGEQAVLTVEDQGIGIAEQEQARLFAKFQRAVSERHYGGLGLGLYIVRQLVDAMGGTVTVRSAPQQGATFTVRLPREPVLPPTDPQAGPRG